MTLRAVFLGILAGVLIAGFGYISDCVLNLTPLVANHFPVIVFGGLFALALGLNPLLRRLRSSWVFQPGELAVIVALTLVGCSIPGNGLMREFTQILVMPAHYGRTTESWRRTDVVGYTPEAMLPAGGEYNERTTGDYVRGSQDKGSRILDVSAVPWNQWVAPLAFWIPVTLLVAISVISLSLIVHPQWSRRELLRYPISAFASSVLAGRTEGSKLPLVRDPVFWIGFGVLFGIRVFNGLGKYFPDYFVEFPLAFSFWQFLVALFPKLPWAWGGWGLMWLHIFPAVVAFAYLLPSEVSLSLGLSQIVSVTLIYVLMVCGIHLGVNNTGGGLLSWHLFGSYFAMALMVFYMGRRYYLSVLSEGILFRPVGRDRPETYAVWAVRILFAASGLLVCLLVWVGLAWPFAVAVVGLMLMAFTVIARITAECGLFRIEATWTAVWVLAGLLGVEAFGPQAFVVAGLLCAVFMIDYSESLMPFVVNGLRICQSANVRPARVGGYGLLVFGAGLAIALPVTLGARYTHGVNLQDQWAAVTVPKNAYDAVAARVTHLEGTGRLAQSEGYGSIDWLPAVAPEPMFLVSAGIGMALVLGCSLLRLRYSKWPLHPVMFLVWGTYPMMILSHSFLLGWAIKSFATKYGGRALYQRLLPLMVGVIGADLLAGLIFMIAGAVYYAVTGAPPPKYHVLPG